MMDITTWAPLRARKTWIVINVICLIWSFILMFELFYTIENIYRLDGTRAYLVYNSITTIVWVVEASLTYYDKKRNLPPDVTIREYWSDDPTKKDIREIYIELCLAVYFLFDSASAFWEWYTPDKDVQGEIFNAFIGVFGYLYQVLSISKAMKDVNDLEEQEREQIVANGQRYDEINDDDESKKSIV